MKKIIAIVLSIVFVAGIGASAYWWTHAQSHGLTIENILPQGAIAYARSTDIEKRLTNFKATLFWQQLKTIDVPMLMKKGGSNAQQIEGVKKLQAMFSDQATNDVFMKIFGQEAAVSVYPVEVISNPAEMWDQILSQIIIVTRLKPDAQFLQWLSTFVNRPSADFTPKVEEYKKQKINIIEIPEQNLKICYVILQDLMVLTKEEATLHKCIEAFLNERSSLDEDPTYQAAQSKFLAGGQTVGYINLEFIFSDMVKQLADLFTEGQDRQAVAKAKQRVDASLAKTAGFKILAYSFSPSTVEQHQYALIYDKEKLNPKLLSIYSCAPQENKSINLVPQKLIGYQWNNCYEPKVQWAMMKEEMKNAESGKQTASVEDMIASIEKTLNLSIEKDILPAFGSELGGYLADLNLKGVFPIPKLVVFIKVADKEKLEHVMTSLTERQSLTLQKEDYQNTSIKYLSLPLGENLDPGYCYLGDYFLLGTSRQALKEAIDVFSHPANALASNQSFKDVDLGLTGKNNSVIFFNLDEVWRVARSMVAWAVSSSKSKIAQNEAFKSDLQQRLEQAKEDLTKEEDSLKPLRADLESAESELRNLQAQAADVTSISAKINALQTQIDEKQSGIAKMKQDQLDLNNTIQSMSTSQPDPDQTQFYVDHLVNPILNGLSYYKTLGSKMIFSDGVIEMMVYIKTQ